MVEHNLQLAAAACYEQRSPEAVHPVLAPERSSWAPYAEGHGAAADCFCRGCVVCFNKGPELDRSPALHLQQELAMPGQCWMSRLLQAWKRSSHLYLMAKHVFGVPHALAAAGLQSGLPIICQL